MQRNTFQLVLASDAHRHVIILHYGGVYYRGKVTSDLSTRRTLQFSLGDFACNVRFLMILKHNDCECSFGLIFTKFRTQFPLDFPKIFLGSPQNGLGQNCVTKFVILLMLIISAYIYDRAFKFYTELMTDKYNN